MLKKDAIFSWSSEAKITFQEIKKAIIEALMLKNLNISKYFIMYTYGAERSIATILAQKDDNKEEHQIAFHSQILHQHQKRYSFIEKKVYFIMKGLKKFKHYVFHNRILVFTIHPDVRNYVIQGDLGERKVGWISKIMEYDIEINPIKLIKGRPTCENIAKVLHMIAIIEDE